MSVVQSRTVSSCQRSRHKSNQPTDRCFSHFSNQVYLVLPDCSHTTHSTVLKRHDRQAVSPSLTVPITNTCSVLYIRTPYLGLTGRDRCLAARWSLVSLSTCQICDLPICQSANLPIPHVVHWYIQTTVTGLDRALTRESPSLHTPRTTNCTCTLHLPALH